MPDVAQMPQRVGATVVGAALVLALAWPAAARTPADSLMVTTAIEGQVFFDGVGCGLAQSRTMALPDRASDVTVDRPRVGDEDAQAKVTAVTVSRARVTITAVGKGPDTCDPGADETQPAQRPWTGGFTVTGSVRRRVQVVIWMDFAGRRRTAVRPKAIRFPMTARVVRVRWTHFGGRMALGSGTLELDSRPGLHCTPLRCPGHDSRVKVLATRPSRCPDLGDTPYYGTVAVVTTTRVGVLKAGTTFIARDPECLTGTPAPAGTSGSRSR